MCVPSKKDSESIWKLGLLGGEYFTQDWKNIGEDVSEKVTIMTTRQVAIIFRGVQAASPGFLRIARASILFHI